MAINFSTYRAPLFKKVHLGVLFGWHAPLNWIPRPEEIETALLFDAVERHLDGYPRRLSINLIAKIQKVSPATIYKRLEDASSWAQAVSRLDYLLRLAWEGQSLWPDDQIHHQINNMVAV